MSASFEITTAGEERRLIAHGDWTLAGDLVRIDDRLRKVDAKSGAVSVDMSDVEALDTAGALMLQRLVMRLRGEECDTPMDGFVGATDQHRHLLEQVAHHFDCAVEEPQSRRSLVLLLDRIGRGVFSAYYDGAKILSFVGETLARIGYLILHPHKFRVTPTVHHMEEAGLNSTLIVGLMSFLIGAVVAFMGARVLASFGAEVFAVELVGISVLREFGVLLTAILIAGRSGSAFTAQIGSMKLREEIDAMRVMGINPLDALVIPRVISLVLMLPILAFLAAFLGVLGGGIVGWLALDIPPQLFMGRTQETVTVSNLMVGLVKAPFFAFVIAIVGCFHGMSVENSAEDLGRRTTMSVVQSLFLVIFIDALFAMLFLELDI